MNNIDTKLRILWLSDIHYKNDYGKQRNTIEPDGNADVLIYVNSFFNYVRLMPVDSYDYILLSGDIAQDGSREDYALFNQDVLCPLQEHFDQAKLLVVPGNHDVARGEASFVTSFIKSLSDDLPERLVFLGDEMADFVKLFGPYSDAFVSNSKLPTKGISETYESSLLYGHVLDVEKKVIFIMLNTAWYSIGNNFLREYLEKHLFDAIRNGSKLDEKELSQITKNIEKIATEYGNQLIGLDKLKDIEEIISLINTYNDYIVITIMHHPINWLDWDERVTNQNKFHQIRQHTDLLLTGHEHVPRIHHPEHINKILHIQAGCFMNASRKNENFILSKENKLTAQNWFSVLNVNVTKRTIEQEKHYFDCEEVIWKKEYEATPNFSNLSKKYNSTLSVKRRNDIIEKASDATYIKRILSKRYPYDKISKIKDNFFHLNEKLYIFINGNEIGIEFDILKAQIDKTKVDTVCFIFVDLFNVGHILYLNNIDLLNENKEVLEKALDMFNLKKEDIVKSEKAQIEKLKVLERIKNDFDFRFDHYRYKVFKNLDKADAEKYQDLKFVSIIKPYWELEAYFNS